MSRPQTPVGSEERYTIVRIKRKRNEEPLDALVVNAPDRKKKTRGSIGVFQYAQTVERDAWENDECRRDLEAQITRLAKENFPSVQTPTSPAKPAETNTSNDGSATTSLTKAELPSPTDPATSATEGLKAPPTIESSAEIMPTPDKMTSTTAEAYSAKASKSGSAIEPPVVASTAEMASPGLASTASPRESLVSASSDEVLTSASSAEALTLASSATVLMPSSTETLPVASTAEGAMPAPCVEVVTHSSSEEVVVLPATDAHSSSLVEVDITEKISSPPIKPREERNRRYTIVNGDFLNDIPKHIIPNNQPAVAVTENKNFQLYDAVPEPVTPPEPSPCSELEKFIPMLNDYLKIHDISPPASPLQGGGGKANLPTSASADDYVWDIFYRRPTPLSEWNEFATFNVAVLTGVPLSADDSYNADSGSEAEDEDDEDSNAEEYYKNEYPDEYPDEDDDSSGSDIFHEGSEHEEMYRHGEAGSWYR